MSDSANYFIRKGKKLRCFFSEWGAPCVPQDASNGPLETLSFVERQEEIALEDVLSFSYMEGAIALDLDKKGAMIFGGPGAVLYRPEVNARLLERIAPAWQAAGWTIEWAPLYAYDVAHFVGVDPITLELPLGLDEPPMSLAQLAKPLPEEDWPEVILARYGNRSVRASAATVPQVLAHGERLFEVIDKLPVVGAVESRPLALVFDRDHKTIELLAPVFGNALQPPHRIAAMAREAFPGWNVELALEDDPVLPRVAALGFEVPALDVPEDERPPSNAEIERIIDDALTIRARIEKEVAALEAATFEAIAEAEAAPGAKVIDLSVKKKK